MKFFSTFYQSVRAPEKQRPYKKTVPIPSAHNKKSLSVSLPIEKTRKKRML